MLSGDAGPLSYRGYRLDGTYPKQPDLRRDANIGACSCCSYFLFSIWGDILLIEDTQLISGIKGKARLQVFEPI